MTHSQSILLKVGARVIFDGNKADRGTVKATNANYLTVKWDDGHESFTGHSNMKRVESMS